ncbi:MAG: DUF3800 domain-containing protein, partial [Propionibacteriaceae bacterium]|nr:DUF3800 domain-containing protein [Propionibacteriaceae bacterium]
RRLYDSGMPSPPHKVWVYIDETGDRGRSQNASPVFGFAALLVDDLGAVDLRRAVQKLRQDFHVPPTRHMSWKDDIKNHDRRRRTAEILGGVRGLRVCYVYIDKGELRPGTYGDRPDVMYNYAAYKLYKSVLWAARNWKGPRAEVSLRFGHVRGHDHKGTLAYIKDQAAKDDRVPNHLQSSLRWVSADQFLESQAADAYAGFLKAALWPDGPFNYVEPAYLLSIWHQINRSDTCCIPLGLMPMPQNDLIRRAPWFPCTCAEANSS